MNLVPFIIHGAKFLAVAVEAQKKWGVGNIIEGKGIILSMIGMSVVFCGLLVLATMLFFLEFFVDAGKKIAKRIRRILTPGVKSGQESGEEEKSQKKMTGEEATAACMALILYHRLHMDEQRQKITFQSALTPLSPWALSGKVRQLGGKPLPHTVPTRHIFDKRCL